MSSSEEDAPLVGKRKTNGLSHAPYPSEELVSKATDPSSTSTPTTNGTTKPGVSIRYGPIDDEDVEMQDGEVNGAPQTKRKSRASAANKSYAEPESSEEDDKPLSKRRRTSTKNRVEDSDSDDAPLLSRSTRAQKLPAPTAAEEKELLAEKAEIEHRAEIEAKAIRKHEREDAAKKKPVGKGAKAPSARQPAKQKPAAGKRTNGIKKSESSDEDLPLRRKPRAKAAKPAKSGTTTPAIKGEDKAKQESEEAEVEAEEEEEYRWWEEPTKGDGTIKWTTLEHNGVVFPPPYEPLPKNVKMKYDGVPISLEPDAEEVAGFFGSMLNSTHNVENPTFQKNFFEDFTAIIKKTGGAKDSQGNKVLIKDFKKCDFRPIFEYYEMKREEKKALPAAERKRLKAEKEAAEAPYMYCMWDGRKQKVGNFRVEPPALFRGRGEHPKTGRVKIRVQPEQITINIGKGAAVPPPPAGHKWKEVKHDQEGTWLAMWQENINGNYKYVMLAANSDIKGQSDFKKFEKARELKKHIDRIRKDYRKGLKDELMANRQRATAVYLIDQFALRAGNEKGEDEADTVGCCSLKYEHVTLKPPNKVIFDFLGKDSIRFYDEVEVDPQVFKNLKIFKKAPKKDGDEIFDRLTTSALNKHLSGYMAGLTAKVFRTYNASYTMATLLRQMNATGTIHEKVKQYNDANRKVAILCNHKRTVAAGHANQMEKLGERIKGLRYQKWRIKQMMLDLDPKIKKKKGAEFFELDPDLDEEWIKQHQAFLVEEQRQKIQKKFDKDNEKLRAEGEKEMKVKELEKRLEVAEELAAKFKKENKTKKVEAEGKGATIEKYENNLAKLDQRIDTMSLQAQDKEDNKEVALGTSKINYIDPRLTVVFSKKFSVPIEKFFSKTLREKFDWAIKSVDENWEF
ncbi:topoisomerase I [Coccidioides immitis RS]|uniref:DNA topoisomerase I n=3 Tax=Coccidioides immitis TaxID=5501 RepID=A0A0E1RXE1_COCIM|nr:topoisomerase I [Coccidioides immitis RS]EAS33798.1 topoisomerase I [Coccidioides immitis RS]KMP04999.1 DNA topoisomerase 1 [Coccidioides immitis RMSCC 2394]KMU91742.1 DNA topoisomerase 1 [Coccidioides immitis H538.4]TPX21435.1 DNA topoisomerase 1 [Coccidioides immitis]